MNTGHYAKIEHMVGVTSHTCKMILENREIFPRGIILKMRWRTAAILQYMQMNINIIIRMIRNRLLD